MTAWAVRLSQSARTTIKRLDRSMQVRIGRKIEQLAKDPVATTKPLHGSELRSARVGDWRRLVDIDFGARGVAVTAIEPRGQVYRRLT